MLKASSGYFAFSKAHREGQRPRCPIRRCTGNEDVAPPVRLNPARSSQSQFQETIVPRVAHVPHVPLRHRQSAKRKASHCTAACKARSSVKWGCALRVVERRPLFCDSVVKDQIGSFLCHFPSAKHIFKASVACNGREVLRGTPEGRHGISAIEAADCLGNREPSTADRCAERVPPVGRDPKTPLAQRYAERARGADSRSRSNLTALRSHMPPWLRGDENHTLLIYSEQKRLFDNNFSCRTARNVHFTLYLSG